MKTTETDVKKKVLESLMALMDSKMLGSMKPEDDEEDDEDEAKPKVAGLSISVIGDDEDADTDADDEDPLQAKLRKLFSKE